MVGSWNCFLNTNNRFSNIIWTVCRFPCSWLFLWIYWNWFIFNINVKTCSFNVPNILRYCNVNFDLFLKDLTKSSLTAAIEQNSNRDSFSFETCWTSLIQPWTCKKKIDFLFPMKARSPAKRKLYYHQFHWRSNPRDDEKE